MYMSLRVGILKTPMQVTQEQLQRSQAKDQLKQAIANRSESEALVAKGLMSGSQMAQSIQPSAKETEFNIKKDSVKYQLEYQSDRRDLEQQGVIYSTTLVRLSRHKITNVTFFKLLKKIDFCCCYCYCCCYGM
ncbi:hypothetical protein RFI_15223 [Reticulomyxa filosa]|uniref:Uncharacterized protein n=1 Tax=Reticulomyxa filosa TaxID=46433 RepID=X6N6T8_RETFI|nr:hypothetical protein RFI_15223 [Reticulomyxa filosa]|eukprot:ETO21980.1 hypothetical protein RFI_15223 [Reticulomyxa filosa]